MTKEEFVALVKRHQAGDADAIRTLRAYADDPRMRREAARRSAQASGASGRRSRSVTPALIISAKGDRFDRFAIRDAMDLLGIKRPVRIQVVRADKLVSEPKPGHDVTGEHEFTPEGTHVIRLRAGRSAKATNRTLWHELAHAAVADGYSSCYRWQRARRDNPDVEAEAHEVARLLSHRVLVR